MLSITCTGYQGNNVVPSSSFAPSSEESGWNLDIHLSRSREMIEYQYRLVEVTESHRVVYDESPGSFASVISDVQIRVLRGYTWRGDEACGKELANELRGEPDFFSNYPGVTYQLQRRPIESTSDFEWKTIATYW